MAETPETNETNETTLAEETNALIDALENDVAVRVVMTLIMAGVDVPFPQEVDNSPHAVLRSVYASDPGAFLEAVFVTLLDMDPAAAVNALFS